MWLIQTLNPPNSQGGTDMLFGRLTAELRWDKVVTAGGTGQDSARTASRLPNGQYLVFGESTSSSSGDVSTSDGIIFSQGAGMKDIAVIRLNAAFESQDALLFGSEEDDGSERFQST